MSFDQWQQRRYEEVFESECAKLQLRRRTDARFTVEGLQGTLDSLYVRQGNDATSQGGPGDIVQAATIAAHEHVLAQWRKELASES